MDIARVRAVLLMSGLPWRELEDGVQQVQLRLLEEQAKGETSVLRYEPAWLAVVASRVAIDWHRSLSRDIGLRARLAARWTRHPPTSHPQEDRTLALAVATALAKLPDKQRQALVLRYYADLTVRQISQLLQVPEGTVKSRLHFASAALKPVLSELEVDRHERG